jgi:hypothetical protein
MVFPSTLDLSRNLTETASVFMAAAACMAKSATYSCVPFQQHALRHCSPFQGSSYRVAPSATQPDPRSSYRFGEGDSVSAAVSALEDTYTYAGKTTRDEQTLVYFIARLDRKIARCPPGVEHPWRSLSCPTRRQGVAFPASLCSNV